MTLSAGYSAVQTFGSVGTRRWAVTPHKMSPVYGYSGYLGLEEYAQPAGRVCQSGFAYIQHNPPPCVWLALPYTASRYAAQRPERHSRTHFSRLHNGSVSLCQGSSVKSTQHRQ